MSSEEIYLFMKNNFPEKNNFLGEKFESSITNLKEFGIHSFDQFKNIIIEQKNELIEYDKNFIKDKIEIYEAMQGKEFVKDRLENEYFFSYQALIAIAMKLKFPNEYAQRESLRNR